MSEAILVALITGGLSLVGVVITCLATSKKAEKAAAVLRSDSADTDVFLHGAYDVGLSRAAGVR